jgi:hypothetical protein
MSGTVPQRLVFTYHKSGTSLLAAVMSKVGQRLGLNVLNRYGFVPHIDHAADIVLLAHSLISALPVRPFRAIRVVRDPRDIWVSGYLYHRRTNEGWCVNTNFDPTPPISYPRVDFSFQHCSEDWKRAYLTRLGGKSYQQNLVARDLAAGLAFELAGYTGCTLAAMRGWRWTSPDILCVRLEDIDAGFDMTMRDIFRHLAFTETEVELALEIAASEDVRRMDDAAVLARPQVQGRRLSKWRAILSDDQIAAFEMHYGDLITEFGYPLVGGKPE